VKRPLLPSGSFLRAAKRFIKGNPRRADDFARTLQRLSEDAHDPRLRTHKLKGALEGSWSCTAGHDLRIIFEFVDCEGKEAILLETVGTHDQVY